MVRFTHEYDSPTKSHVLEVHDKDERVMSVSISEYKMGERTISEVIDCTLGAVVKVLNELNEEAKDE